MGVLGRGGTVVLFRRTERSGRNAKSVGGVESGTADLHLYRRSVLHIDRVAIIIINIASSAGESTVGWACEWVVRRSDGEDNYRVCC